MLGTRGILLLEMFLNFLNFKKDNTMIWSTFMEDKKINFYSISSAKSLDHCLSN